MDYIAIMAGGIGSRFWPASRSSRPKQFLDIMGSGKSLLRMTYERFLRLVPSDNILIVTNKDYVELVKEHIPELSYNQILGEPSRNNTGPCVAYTAFKLEQMNPNARFVIAPSDHLIQEEEKFITTIRQALDFAADNDALLTLGIQPDHPNTGYGYINFGDAVADGIHKVKRFTEKPDITTAAQFLQSGDYLWNAGIFIWSVSSILKAFEEHAGDIYSILSAGRQMYNSPEEEDFISANYPQDAEHFN